MVFGGLWRRWLEARRARRAAGTVNHRDEAQREARESVDDPRAGSAGDPGKSSDRTEREQASARLVDEMIRLGRVALLLRKQIAANLSPDEHARALATLEDKMALVPEGEVLMLPTLSSMDDCGAPPVLHVDAIFLDRRPVTNAEYQAFVDGGGYEQMPLWDESIWAALLEFVDRTGHAGPAAWREGKFLPGTEHHPVVGISWYEAAAYARWVGKRLPSGPEWVKAACWPVATPGGKPCQRRFPWGETMDRSKTHLWNGDDLGTVPVDATPGGASVGGIEQMIGNVWEWTSSLYASWDPVGERLDGDLPLQGIRGGSFATYFDSQATCQFQSGESPLSRRDNIGFRCALSLCDVVFFDSGPAGEWDATVPSSFGQPVEEAAR